MVQVFERCDEKREMEMARERKLMTTRAARARSFIFTLLLVKLPRDLFSRH